MAVQARISSPDDREGITELMHRAFGAELAPASVDPAFQQWKYWEGHPLSGDRRSYILNGKDRIVGHACRWPMRILTTTGAFDAFHLIDWAADSSHAGAGLQVLRDSSEGSAAVFSIGGSPVTRRVLPALGEHLRRRSKEPGASSYQVAGTMYFLSRPLKPVTAALSDSPLGWKTPARIARNAMYSVRPSTRLPLGVTFEPVRPAAIPPELWPQATPQYSVSSRSPELLLHFWNCPVLQRHMCFVLKRMNRPIGYFFLVLAGNQVRLADYGPAGLDSYHARLIGIAAQRAAKRYYPDAVRISVATSEITGRSGFADSGFRNTYHEEIRGLVVDPALMPVKQYRLTYLDLDALCL